MNTKEKYPSIWVHPHEALSLEKFKEMDYFAVSQFDIPISAMMEMAGLQLASLISNAHPDLSTTVHFCIGPGNNGGGGLVAARRLAGWGYSVSFELFKHPGNQLLKTQLHRALKVGAKNNPLDAPEVMVDAILGFSQRAPLGTELSNYLKKINAIDAHKFSLDLPTGLFDEGSTDFFKPDVILTLAAPKKLLFYPQIKSSEMYVADLGLPISLFKRFKYAFELPFHISSIVQLKLVR